jgi:hypothetical protein
MVPIYAIDSWLGLRFYTLCVYFDILREIYEALVRGCTARSESPSSLLGASQLFVCRHVCSASTHAHLCMCV